MMFGMGRIAVLFAFALLGAGAAGAGDAPVIVIPGKAGVPVIINGFDASFAVVEGDWGLERPGQVPATIVTGPLIVPEPGYSRSYFPAFGRRPGYGRREVEPPANRRLPPPAERYERFWGAESAPLSATVEPSAERAQINVEANGDQRNGRRWHAQRRSPEKGKHPPSRAHAH